LRNAHDPIEQEVPSMTEPAATHVVVDEPAQHRFLVEEDGRTAELVYQRDGDRFVLVHTGVPDEVGGRGIAQALVRTAVSRARDEGLTVVPWCPFARAWLKAHPEVLAGVGVDWTPRPVQSE
jgi:uncharacterized protein